MLGLPATPAHAHPDHHQPTQQGSHTAGQQHTNPQHDHDHSHDHSH
ncbi:hypothetical protein [Cyanobium sp. NIES-981]|nr:hypothetical protein [Cyanobium sp. NIES-981]